MFRKIGLAIGLFSLFARVAAASPNLTKESLRLPETIPHAPLAGDVGGPVFEPSMYEAPTRLAHVFAVPVGSHSAGLNWILSVDDDAGAATPVNCVAAAGCAQNVYRAQGLCTSTTAFTLLTTTPLGATATTFTDSTVTPGNWCYGVTFTMNGLESSKDSASVSLQPASPTGLAGIPH